MSHPKILTLCPTLKPIPKIWFQDVPQPEATAYGFAAGKDLHAAEHLGKTHHLLEEFGNDVGYMFDRKSMTICFGFWDCF